MVVLRVANLIRHDSDPDTSFIQFKCQIKLFLPDEVWRDRIDKGGLGSGSQKENFGTRYGFGIQELDPSDSDL